MPVREDVAEYFRTYDRDSYEVFGVGVNAPSEADIEAFEQRIGFRLPDEFREFTMSELGGLYVVVREELWPRPKLFDVGPAWTFDYGLKVFGISSDIPEWLDLRVQHLEFQERSGGADLVPVLQEVMDANRYCYTRDGGLVLWDHEVPDELESYNGSFSDLLMEQISGLAERLARRLATPQS